MSAGREPTGLARLAVFMDQAARDQQLSLSELAARAGIDRQTLYNIQQGKSVKPRKATREGIERALGWADGSVEAILADGDPVPREPSRQATSASRPASGGWSAEGVPVDEEGMPWTPERIWAVLDFVRRNTDDPLAWYRALYDAAQKWGIPPSVGNQSRQTG